MKRKIKIMLGDLTHTGVNLNSDHFPLGIGFIASYTLKVLKDEVETSLHKLPEELLEELPKFKPDFLCFSQYNWNAKLSYTIASYAKKINPKIITIFGGPDFPAEKNARHNFLKERPAIDFYIKSDAEYAFVRLVKKLADLELKVKKFKDSSIKLPNICYVKDEHYIEGQYERVENLMDIPSPYVTGLLDKFFELPLLPNIQTNRGCPYSCTFCVDGEISNRKIHRKSNAYMYEELEYIASHVKLTPTLAFSDLNFGMYKQDIETAKIIRDIRRKYNWPKLMFGSTGKSQPERLAEVGKIINEGGIDIIRMGSSMQSASPEVLKEIKRTNLGADELRVLHHNNVDSQNFTEFIIPLPRETKKSFLTGLTQAVDDIRFNNIAVHHLQLLKGSEMETEEQRLKYGMENKYRVYEACLGNYKIGEEMVPIAEIEEIVVGTNTMSSKEYFDLTVVNLLIKIFLHGDTYKPIFEVVRRNNIKSMEVITQILEVTSNEFSQFRIFLDDFVKVGKNKCFDSKEELEKTLTSPKAIDNLINSGSVQNELLAFRAQALRKHYKVCTLVLQSAIKSILRKRNIEHDELDEYLNEAFRFCEIRKFNFVDMKDCEDNFSFDFVKGDKNNFDIDPKEIHNNVNIRFYYKDERDTYNKYLKFFGNSNDYQWGKIIQRMDWIRMRKRIEYSKQANI